MSDWKKDVFRQKSLWQVYQISRKSFPRRGSSKAIFSIFLLLGLAFTVWGAFFGKNVYTIGQSAQLVHDVVDGCFVFALSILGFLVAGFSIFASVTKVDLFILLAQLPYKNEGKETGLSRLQFIFFNFLNVFSIYLWLLAFCLFVKIGFSPQSPVTRASEMLSTLYPIVVLTINFFAASLLTVWLIDALLRLKAFIWNLYQAVLLSIVTEAELLDRKAQTDTKDSVD